MPTVKTLLFGAVLSLGLAVSDPLPARAELTDLLDMSEQFDKIEKQDFNAALGRAASCTSARNFGCAEKELAKAAKVTNSAKDRQSLTAARQKLANEKQALQEEQRLAVEETERQRVAAAREIERQRVAEESNGFQWGKAAALMAGAGIGGIGKMSAEVQTKVITGIIKDSMAGQEGIGNFKDTSDSILAEQKTQQSIAAQRTRERQAKAVADEAANNERLLDASRNERKATLERQAKAIAAEEARNKKALEASKSAKQHNNGKQRLQSSNELKNEPSTSQAVRQANQAAKQQQPPHLAKLDNAGNLKAGIAKKPATAPPLEVYDRNGLVGGASKSPLVAAAATSGGGYPSLTSVLDISVMQPPPNAKGTDALNVAWEQSESYRCLDFPPTTVSIPGGACKPQVMALKRVQCRADWLKSPELQAYVGCLASGSTDDYKAYYLKIGKLLR